MAHRAKPHQTTVKIDHKNLYNIIKLPELLYQINLNPNGFTDETSVVSRASMVIVGASDLAA
jgi:hypothetical protein